MFAQNGLVNNLFGTSSLPTKGVKEIEEKNRPYVFGCARQRVKITIYDLFYLITVTKFNACKLVQNNTAPVESNLTEDNPLTFLPVAPSILSLQFCVSSCKCYRMEPHVHTKSTLNKGNESVTHAKTESCF